MTEKRYPPVTELGMFSLALIVAGGIYLSSHIPEHVPLAPAIALLVASTVVLVLNYVLLGRVEDFAWGRFFQVGAVLAAITNRNLDDRPGCFVTGLDRPKESS